MCTFTKEQYDYAARRVKELLETVNDNTSVKADSNIELSIMSKVIEVYEASKAETLSLSFGDIIKAGLKDKGWKQLRLAQEENTSPTKMSNIITGKMEVSLELACKIAKVLDIAPEVIMAL